MVNKVVQGINQLHTQALGLKTGMTFVIATGGIDISQGSVIAISGAVCCSLIGGAGDGTARMPLVLACLIAVTVCMVKHSPHKIGPLDDGGCWQFNRCMLIGRPTMLDAPMTTAFRP